MISFVRSSVNRRRRAELAMSSPSKPTQRRAGRLLHTRGACPLESGRIRPQTTGPAGRLGLSADDLGRRKHARRVLVHGVVPYSIDWDPEPSRKAPSILWLGTF